MKVMVVGSGGREHALIKAVSKNPKVEALYALPGNGGIARDAQCVDIGAKDIQGIVWFAEQNGIDFAIVAPDDPLALGAVDALEAKGIPCFGPSAKAAMIESSKVFSKGLMQKYGIPTAAFSAFSEIDAALEHLKTVKLPVVVKADGLALGKGVVIAQTLTEAQAAVRAMMQDKVFGQSGNSIVVEEYLSGPEVSLLAFTDGKTIVPMVSSMDHKRALDEDRGLNTGGMGAVAPNPYYTEAIAQRCMQEIFLPTLEAMRSEGRPFKGCLYFGLMLTEDGPKVIEYNCRFGDPEAQTVLPLLETDLLDILLAVAEERLGEADVRFSAGASCCVVMASKGYPEQYETGYEIHIPKDLNAEVYAAGVKLEGEKLVTSGGRVLGVVCTDLTLKGAIDKAYAATARISFDNAYYRKDIGKSALAALEG